MSEDYNKKTNENKIEGRNAVLEAFRSGKPVDKLFVLDGCQDGPVRTIVREAKKHDTIIHFVEKRASGSALGDEEAPGRDRGGGSVRICGSGRHSGDRKRKGRAAVPFSAG